MKTLHAVQPQTEVWAYYEAEAKELGSVLLLEGRHVLSFLK